MRTVIAEVLFCCSLMLPSPMNAQDEADRTLSVGLMVGDPIAASLMLPIGRADFFNLRAGVYTWRLWEQPVIFDVPYVSIDFGHRFSLGGWPDKLYLGAGLAFFFQDNPKDNDDSSGAIAIRVPVGIQLFATNGFALDAELALVHQFAPWYVAQPNFIELNGGVVARYIF